VDQPVTSADVVIVGGGGAALSTLAHLPPRMRAIIVTPPRDSPATAWAKGGLAAATGPNDSPEAHLADTLHAAAGLADDLAARILAEEAPLALKELLAIGVPFDRSCALEGGHSCARIHHAGGDRTGLAVLTALRHHPRVRESARVRAVLDGLLLDDHGIQGVTLRTSTDTLTISTPRVILATGGYASLWRHRTTPPLATGEGILLAYLAGATLVDLEFVQFHPTAIALGRSPLPLATEALRGHGAHLVDAAGVRLTNGPGGDLAPRDVVARVLASYPGPTYLDARSIGARGLREKFPAFYAAAMRHGHDPSRDLVPVVPAAHYTMGGILTDTYGRTTVTGLWAVGEAACTGLHGANRLASNSLVEGLVWGRRAASDIAATPATSGRPLRPVQIATPPRSRAGLARSRALLARVAGVVRDGPTLASALSELSEASLDSSRHLARLVIESALARTESVGSHLRQDAAKADPHYRILHQLGMPPRRAPRAPWT